ncbi:MAG TPA: hypothetical protein DHU89_01345 [Flavobacteriales bacterium]|nr:hypothetical protein [Flavobacteriales bacterium]
MKNNPGNRGLGIPEDYFSNLESSILNEIECLELEKEIERKVGRKSGLDVPSHFFDEFSVRTNMPKASGKLTTLLISSLSVAASLALVFTLIQLSSSGNQTELTEQSFNELLAETSISEEYLNYLELEELTSIYAEMDYENMFAIESSPESIDFLLEDEAFLEEIVNELDNI